MGKQILKYKKIKKTHITIIIFHNYILSKGDLTYIRTFPVNLRMALIFTDFQQEMDLQHMLYWKSVNIRAIPK